MKEETFAELLASVREGAAILNGQQTASRSFEMSGQDVKAVRERLKLSQQQFALLLGVSVNTLQNWEQGRRKPRGAVKVLLRVAERHPDILLDLLRQK
ncbi:MAG TPA: transcriptional regulator [Anaerolineaceae bacterium]|nr:transcriptional regulator [Anaerolineaceae bacterium]